MLDYKLIGRNIRKYRKLYNYSQEQLAEKIQISTIHMSHIETGNTKLSLPVFCDIAKALNVSTDLLLSNVPVGDEESTKQEVTLLLESCNEKQAELLMNLLTAIKPEIEKLEL